METNNTSNQTNMDIDQQSQLTSAIQNITESLMEQVMTTQDTKKQKLEGEQKTDDNQSQSTAAEPQSALKQGMDKLRTDIENWRKENTYVKLILAGVHESDYQLQFRIGNKGIPFFVHLNENFKPWFISSDSAEVEEYITPINFQMEDLNQHNTPMEVTQLLNLFALSFKELERSNNIQSGTMSPSLPPRDFLHDLPPPREEKPTVMPTVADFDDTIIPAYLEKDNFQEYEIQEWTRRIQAHLKRGNIRQALELVRADILGHNVPEEISHFFPRRRIGFHLENDEEQYANQFDIPSEQNEKKWTDVGAASEAIDRLKHELMQLKEVNTKELGFEASPSGNDLFHWHVKLFGFGHDTPLGQGLMEWALKHTTINDQTKLLEGDVLLELKFPLNFPHSPPLFRIIRPVFANIDVDLSLSQTTTTTTTTSTTNPNVNNSSMDEEATLFSSPKPSGIRKALSVSRAIEKSKDSWVPSTGIIDYIQQIRTFMVESGARVDLEASAQGYSLPTVGRFWRSYSAALPTSVGKPDLENGGKILLPISALEELSQEMDNQPYGYYGGPMSLRQSNSGSSFFLFEISTEKGKRSFCGVEEFTAPEGAVVLPAWMLNNLGAKEGAQVQIRRVNLPKGNFVKLQPHTADFLEVNDTKAMLEWVLPKFVVMCVGDTIVITYRNKQYAFNILEVKPGRAIHIIDSDVTTEFAPPLSGAENFAYNTTAISVPDSTAKEPKTPEKVASSPGGLLSVSPGNILSASPGTTLGSLSVDDNAVEGVDFKVCDNCKRKIPTGVFNNHTLSCVRMNWFCEACQVSVPKREKDEHMKVAHTIVYCECGAPLESRNLQAHKSNDCSKRIVTCSYCPLEMTYVEKFEHERKCGSQTQPCEICHKYIQKRDMPVHIVECQETRNNRDTLMAQVSSKNFLSPKRRPQNEDLFSCPNCSTPFEHWDDLQVHMITEHFESETATMEEDKKEAPSPNAVTTSSPTPIPTSSQSSTTSASTDLNPMDQ